MTELFEICGHLSKLELSELAITRLRTEYEVLKLQVEYCAHRTVTSEKRVKFL